MLCFSAVIIFFVTSSGYAIHMMTGKKKGGFTKFNSCAVTLHFSSVTQGEIWPSTKKSRVPGFAYQVWHLFGMFAVKIPIRRLRKWLWRDLWLALMVWEPSERKPHVGESFASVQEQPCVQPVPGSPCSNSECSVWEWAGHGTRFNTVTVPAGKSCTGTKRRAERWSQRAG